MKGSRNALEKWRNAARIRKPVAWVDAILPFNIALGPVGTLIQLLILNLHGTVIDVALAITLFNAVSVPAAMMWGFVTDRFHRRKTMIVASYLTTAAILVSFLFATTGYLVSLLYAAFSFVTTASATPLNLLIMETERKQKWATAFARFSMVTSIGQTVGLVISVGWGAFFPLQYLVIPLAILSIISAALSVLMIKEPSVVFERQAIALNKPSFFHRILAIPFFFLRIPRLNDFKRVFRDIKYELTRQIPILYFSIFMFYLASGIFNTSIVPSLQANNVSSFLIFLVTTVTMVVQIVSFKYAGPYTEKKSPVKAAIGGLVLRSLGYGFLGVSLYIVTGVLFLAPVLIFYPLAAGFAYAVYYTASNTMIFHSLHEGRQGSSLGVYSALVGIATMLGSLISGFTSFFLGYSITFIIAAMLLAVSAWLASLLSHSNSDIDTAK
ncbi:MAG: MFS transporter [Candidatus Bathyarchaeota archaeon]|nr:MFS transporter [Candidatus Bathyarchaeota archaeon]